MYVWSVDSTVTKHSDYFVEKDTSDMTRRCDDTVDKKRANLVSLSLKNNLCRFLYALLVPAEAEGHQQPAVWKVLPTASAVLPVLDHFCWTHFLGEVDWC